ncbi:MAG: NTP transferase domain-containing protein [Oscillospiraceae bacterium]|jgi:molybdenum-dependent DNA-binding transcriptional regulator ModE/CTP:molybdopterin cytidylyltransferase MocA|nr:NTP transferase domain-containing protein [Oscillospiraceae bacterium]
MPTAAVIVVPKSGIDVTQEIAGLEPVQRLVLTFQLAGIDRVVVALDSDMREIQKFCVRLGAYFTRRAETDAQGEPGIIAAALRYLDGKCGRAFIVSANYSLIEPETVRALARSDAPIVFPAYKGKRGGLVLLGSDMFGDAALHGLNALAASKLAAEVETADAGITANTAAADAIDKIAGKLALNNVLRFKIKVSLAYEKSFIGPGVVQLAHLIGETNSLTRSCDIMGMSLSRGIHIVRALEKSLGFRVYDVSPNKSKGEGCFLTKEFSAYLGRYEAFAAECAALTAEAFARHFGGEAR